LVGLAFVALVAILASPHAGAAPEAAAGWPQYGFDPAHTGYNPLEDSIGVSNVSQLTRAWRGAVGAGVVGVSVANGVAYVGADDGRLYVFDAAGVTNCSGVPKICEPLWTALTSKDHFVNTPAVVDGVVYVSSSDGRVYAFDANGVTNCFGVPKRCRPLWYSTNVAVWGSSPAVSGGVVFVGGDNTLQGNLGMSLFAFDAAGLTGCQGSPTRICQPIWSGRTFGLVSVFSTPAVADGMVFIGSLTGDLEFGSLDAFAAGGCGDQICDPLWTVAWTGPYSFAGDHSPSIANGLVYEVRDDGSMFAFDETTGTLVWNPGSRNATSDVVVANDVAYAGWGREGLAAFDAAGITNCVNGGNHYHCEPLWTAKRTRSFSGEDLAVANGVVYVHTFLGDLGAYDAAGVVNCSGQPVVCGPLWQTRGIDSRPIVVNGTLYAGGSEGDLNVFALP
jgi:outer membrane protein assembly factor BamB